jgi:hypothetical protein
MISNIGNLIKNKVIDLKSELNYRTDLIQHAGKLPALEESDRKIVDALKTEGTYVTSLEELGISSTAILLKSASNYLSDMLSVNYSDKTEKLPQIYTMTGLPEFSQWGKDNRLISIIENYIGLTVAFHGVHLRKDFPNEKQFGTLLWHKDSEDRRIIKVIVYLSDVEEHHGPFEYIPLSLTSAPSPNYFRLYYKLWQSNYIGIDDKQVQEVIPKKYWKSCPGPAGTVIFTDPRRVLHHGTLRTQDRSALFFVYTANPPQRPELCTQYWDDTFPRPEVLCKV